MTGKELGKLGNAAFGVHWKTPVREALGVSREMLWRYETSNTPMTEEFMEKVRKLFKREIEKRRDSLSALLKTL